MVTVMKLLLFDLLRWLQYPGHVSAMILLHDHTHTRGHLVLSPTPFSMAGGRSARDVLVRWVLSFRLFIRGCGPVLVTPSLCGFLSCVRDDL